MSEPILLGKAEGLVALLYDVAALARTHAQAGQRGGAPALLLQRLPFEQQRAQAIASVRVDETGHDGTDLPALAGSGCGPARPMRRVPNETGLRDVDRGGGPRDRGRS